MEGRGRSLRLLIVVRTLGKIAHSMLGIAIRVPGVVGEKHGAESNARSMPSSSFYSLSYSYGQTATPFAPTTLPKTDCVPSE